LTVRVIIERERERERVSERVYVILRFYLVRERVRERERDLNFELIVCCILYIVEGKIDREGEREKWC